MRQCLIHCKVLPFNAFDNITFDIVFSDLFWILLYFNLNFSILLIVMSNDIVDIDRALGGDLWVVQETEQLQRTFTKMVGGFVNDSEDVLVKGPEKMSADFYSFY